MNTKFNRTVLVLAFMILAGFLAYIEAADVLAIIGGVGGVLTAYIGIKGKEG